MKVALIERVKDGRKVEIRELNEEKLLASFIEIGEKDIYNGFIAKNIHGDKFYITIVNYKEGK